MKKNLCKKMLLIYVFIVCTIHLFGTIPGTSHTCETQGATSVEFRFTIPSTDTTGTIHRVLVDFQINTAPITPGNVQITPPNQCPDCTSCNCTFSSFYTGNPTQQIDTDILSTNDGYLLRLINLGANHYQIEIINKSEASGLWNQGTSVDEWIVNLSGLPGAGYQFSLLSIVGKNISDGDVIDPNLQFTYSSPCNQAPTATIGIASPDTLTNAGDDYYGFSPLLLNLTGGYTDLGDSYGADDIYSYHWTIAGTPSTTQNPSVSLETGIHTITLYVEDAFSVQSPTITKTINVLPKDLVTFPRARGLPYDSGKEPYIDGQLIGSDGQGTPDYGENGWRGAHKLTFAGGSTLDGSIQFLKSQGTPQYLYVGFDIESDTASITDTIVMGFRSGADDRLGAYNINGAVLFYITPNDSDPAPLEADVSRYVMTGGSWVGGAVTDAALTAPGEDWEIGVIPSGNNWTMEIKIPVAAGVTTGVPGLADDFLYFFNVFKTFSGPTVVEMHWPREVEDVGNAGVDIVADRDTIDQFQPRWWARADKSNTLTANGLSFPDYSYVGVDTGGTTLSSSIVTNGNNTFVARVLNTSQKELDYDFGSGLEDAIQTIPVNNVTVTFKYANWGIPPTSTDYWIEIPENPGYNNPQTLNVTAPATGSAGGGYIYRVSTETVPNDHTTEFSFVCHPADRGMNIDQTHQCIYVEMTTDNEADIVTKSVHRNMNFDATNENIFIHQAEISAQGYGIPLDNEPNHKFLLRIFTKEWKVEKEDIEYLNRIKEKNNQLLVKTSTDTMAAAVDVEQPPVIQDEKLKKILSLPHIEKIWQYIQEEQETVSFIEYIVKGYLYTGKKVTIRETEHDLVKAIGSYGHVVRHVGEVDKWEFEIEGAEKIDDNTFIIEIPPEQTAIVHDKVNAIEPPEPPKFMIHLYGGGAYNIDALASDYTFGVNGIFGIGYRVLPIMSLNILLGYNYFFSDTTGVDDYTLMSLSLNARLHRNLGQALSLYIGIGPGLYLDPDFNIEYGANAGLGININPSPYFGIEVGADYHYFINTYTQFFHAHAGLQLRF